MMKNHGMLLYMMQQIHSYILKCNKKKIDLMPLLFVHYSNMILTLQSIDFGICLASLWINVLFFGESTLDILGQNVVLLFSRKLFSKMPTV